MTLETIDMSEKLEAIWQQHGGDWRSKAYRADKAALWGYVQSSENINGCGVISGAEKETLYEKSLSYARISLVETPIGLWIHAITWASLTCGGGYAPSTSTAIAHKSRQGARLAAIEKLICRYSSIEVERGYSESESKQALEVLRILNDEKTPQLALW
jgi:hypothetical protein